MCTSYIVFIHINFLFRAHKYRLYNFSTIINASILHSIFNVNIYYSDLFTRNHFEIEIILAGGIRINLENARDVPYKST